MSLGMGELKVLAHEAYERWWWAQERQHLTADAPVDPPLLQPLRDYVRTASPSKAGLVRMVLEGGAWTQQRLYDHRYVVDPACLLCGEPGTFLHRCYSCPATFWFRYEYADGSPPDRAVRAVDAPALWQRLLARDPSWQAPPPLLSAAVVWEIHPQAGHFDELGFGDGSILDGRFPRLARGGWGLVVLDQHRHETARLHGPLPGLHQDITLAELTALEWYLKHIGPAGGNFHTDCHNIIKMWETGEQTCCDAFSIYSSVWRSIWRRVHDLGYELITLTWVKGHATDRHIRDGAITAWQRDANQWADRQAKLGAAMHPRNPDLFDDCTGASENMKWLADFVAAVHKHCLDRKLADYAWPERQRPAGRGARSTQLVVTRHNHYRVRRQASLEKSHVLLQSGRVTWCCRCGYYADRICRRLAQPCPRVPTKTIRIKQLRRLMAGVHPRTGEALGPVRRGWFVQAPPVGPCM